MTIGDVWRGIRDYRSSRKISLDSVVDPLLAWTTLNAAYLYGGDQAFNYVSSIAGDNHNAAILGTCAVLTTGLLAANRYVINPTARAIRRLHQRRRAAGREATAFSWARTTAQLGLMAWLALTPQAQKTIQDYKAGFPDEHAEIYPIYTITEPASPVDSTKDVEIIRLEDCSLDNDDGRFCRTYRWQHIIGAAETKYGLEKGLLAGLVINESGGNPLALGLSGEGDAGLYQFLPGTASDQGLKVLDNCKSVTGDKAHGAALLALMKQKGFDYSVLSRQDERFDVVKSTDAAAGYLAKLIKQHGSTNAGLSAYNRGHPSANPDSTEYVKRVRKHQEFYLTRLAALE